MSSQLYLGCSLCGVALAPNTQCDHACFIRTETEISENQKVVVKKSIFGDKTKDEVKITHQITDHLVCQCGVQLPAMIINECDQSEDGDECSHPKRKLPDTNQLACWRKADPHICALAYVGPRNRLQWLSKNDTSKLVHPSGLKYRHNCKYCKGKGTCTAETYQPCDVCSGTGGLKCTSCPGLGYVPCDYRGCLSPCPRECQMGYKKRCLACNGAQAIVTGTREIVCKKCVLVPKPNVRNITVNTSQSSSSTVRPPSPSQMSLASQLHI